MRRGFASKDRPHDRQDLVHQSASSGFCRALAQHALAQGHNVVAAACKISTLASIAATAPERVLALSLNVTRQSEADVAIKAAVARFHRIDVLINNAGYGLVGAFEETSDSELRASMDTNFFGAMNVTRAALPTMKRQGNGPIVLVSSAPAATSTLQRSVPGRSTLPAP